MIDVCKFVNKITGKFESDFSGRNKKARDLVSITITLAWRNDWN